MNLRTFLLSIFFIIGAVYFRGKPDFKTSQNPPALIEEPLQGNKRIDNFNQAKVILFDIYREHPITFYCGCRFFGREVDLKSCNYIPQKSYERAKRVEWEHIVPASSFGQSFSAWRDGHPDCVDSKGRSFRGRRCAQLVSATFRRMEADMHNLVPAIGEVNGLRSNYDMGVIEGSQGQLGNCSTKIWNKTIEPRPEDQGFVARAYLYMDTSYPGHGIISRKNKKLFAAWNRMHPPTPFERKRAKIIARIQGNTNSFIEDNKIASGEENCSHSKQGKSCLE